jgi:hypothetical protein
MSTGDPLPELLQGVQADAHFDRGFVTASLRSSSPTSCRRIRNSCTDRWDPERVLEYSQLHPVLSTDAAKPKAESRP